jgi:hypothetical protein
MRNAGNPFALNFHSSFRGCAKRVTRNPVPWIQADKQSLDSGSPLRGVRNDDRNIIVRHDLASRETTR